MAHVHTLIIRQACGIGWSPGFRKHSIHPFFPCYSFCYISLVIVRIVSPPLPRLELLFLSLPKVLQDFLLFPQLEHSTLLIFIQQLPLSLSYSCGRQITAHFISLLLNIATLSQKLFHAIRGRTLILKRVQNLFLLFNLLRRVRKRVRCCSVLQMTPLDLHKHAPQIFTISTVGKFQLNLLRIHILSLSELVSRPENLVGNARRQISNDIRRKRQLFHLFRSKAISQ